MLPCALPHATPSCNSGVCAILSCAPGFADCDKVAANGCEVDLTQDPKNCGTCAHVCGTGVCGQSVSAPMTVKATDWIWNGAAFWDNTTNTGALTPVDFNRTGTIIYKNPIIADTFDVSFDFQISGGTGADGMAFMIEQDGNTAMGLGAGGLGVAGLHGFGVEIDEFANKTCGDDVFGHIAVDNLLLCGTLPTMLSVNNTLNVNGKYLNLHNGGWHSCVIHLENSAMGVQCDGGLVLAPANLPGFTSGQPYYFGFGGATGGETDKHEVRNVRISFPTPRCL
jgi:hypothetical protein